MKKQHLIVLLMLLIEACSHIPAPTERSVDALKSANQHGWEKLALFTDTFVLQAFMPAMPNHTETLTIYIEGDGLAWVKPTIPSADPTPLNPMALKLALLDSHPAAYLTRPCQFVSETQTQHCSPQYWTSHRFSPEVILSSSQAIDQIKQKFGAQNLILVGYSGGGAIAALVAANRHDVIKLITVAGNLDHARWTAQRHVSPLSGSLNPADAWKNLQEIAQRHYVGGEDSIINVEIAQSYANHFPNIKQPSITVIKAFDHHCCWESAWPGIVRSNFGGLEDIPNINTIQNH